MFIKRFSFISAIPTRLKGSLSKSLGRSARFGAALLLGVVLAACGGGSNDSTPTHLGVSATQYRTAFEEQAANLGLEIALPAMTLDSTTRKYVAEIDPGVTVTATADPSSANKNLNEVVISTTVDAEDEAEITTWTYAAMISMMALDFGLKKEEMIELVESMLLEAEQISADSGSIVRDYRHRRYVVSFDYRDDERLKLAFAITPH